MSSILKLSTALFVCFFVIACGQSGNEEGSSNQNAISTNTTENPLTIPANPVSTTSTSQTIYAIWVLDSVNNKLIDSTHYSGRGKPYFNFNLEKKSLSGFTGCGGINGKLKTLGEKLIFDHLVVTSQDCKIRAFEKKIVNGFKSGKTTYKIVNDNLHLDIGGGTTLILRKIG